jgi:predicted hydrocarbon binding protein
MGEKKLKNQLEGVLIVMASLSHGLEQVLGRGATTVTFRAGRAVGLKAVTKRKETDLIKALDVVGQELKEKGIIWPFEPWKPAQTTDYMYDKNGKRAMKLVFRNCMVRCALFRYSHEQRQSLCMMNHGLFCGYVQNITGKRADLEIVHAGENACLKELIVSID